MTGRIASTALTAAALAIGQPSVAPASAQPVMRAPASVPRLVPEVRVDAALGTAGGGFGGLGLFGDAGLYTRLGLVAAVGAVHVPGGFTGAGRLEALARFHLDPQRSSRRGVYASGGLGVALQRGAGPRYGLVALVGVEGATRGGLAPALEAGLGGGVRVGAVLRRARPGRR